MAGPALAGAATGPQNFSDGATHTVTDSIVDTTSGYGLSAVNSNTIANMGNVGGAALFVTSSGFAGAYSYNGGTVNLVNVNVFSSGARGVDADISSTLTMTGGSVTTTGTAVGGFGQNCAD